MPSLRPVVRIVITAVLLALPAGARLAAAAHFVRDAAQLARAIAGAAPGDEIVMREGVWRDMRIAFEAQGTKDAPITLRAATPGRVTLTGRSALRIGGDHLIVSGLCFRDIDIGETVIEFRSNGRISNDSRLTECAIVNCNPRDRGTNTKWVSLHGARNRVDHCYLEGKTNLGTTLVVWLSDQPNNHRIDHNHFGPRSRLGQNGGETIRIGTSHWSMHVSRTLVESNLFERCNGEVEIISSKSCENVYRNNTFVECEGALTLRHGNRCVVEGNYFLGGNRPDTGGVRVIGEDHRVINNYFGQLAGTGSRSALSVMLGIPDSPLAGYFQVKRAVIAFNTFVECASSLMMGQPGSRASLPPEDVMIANNVFFQPRGPILRQTLEPVRVRFAGNVAAGAGEDDSANFATRVIDARLAQGADGVFRLAGDSPLRGAASGVFTEVLHDIDGQPRESPADVGCDQVSSAPRRWRRLYPQDVGPAWMSERGAAR